VDGDGTVELISADGDEEMIAFSELRMENQRRAGGEFLTEVGAVAAIRARPETEALGVLREVGGEDAAQTPFMNRGGDFVLRGAVPVVVRDHRERSRTAILRLLRNKWHRQ